VIVRRANSIPTTAASGVYWQGAKMYKFLSMAVTVLVLSVGFAPAHDVSSLKVVGATATDHGVVTPVLTANNHGIVTTLPTIIGTQDGGPGHKITLYNNSGAAANIALQWQGAYLINSDAPPSELYWADAASIGTPLNAPHELATRAYPSFFEQVAVVGNATLPNGATHSYVLVGRSKVEGCAFQVATAGQAANGGSPLIIWHSDRLINLVTADSKESQQLVQQSALADAGRLLTPEDVDVLL